MSVENMNSNQVDFIGLPNPIQKKCNIHFYDSEEISLRCIHFGQKIQLIEQNKYHPKHKFNGKIHSSMELSRCYEV